MVVESNGQKKTIILNPMQPEAQNKINPPTQGIGLGWFRQIGGLDAHS